MNFADYKSITIPEGKVQKITCDGTLLWEAKASYTNLLPTAIDTDGSIYNGIGYKPNTRLSSSGSTASSTAEMNASGFIKASDGDVVCIKGARPVKGTATYIITYNSAKTKVMHQTFPIKSTMPPDYSLNTTWYTYKDGILTIPLTSGNFGTGIAFFRFSGKMDENTIVTVNEEIT